MGGPAAADEFEFFGVGELAFTVGDLVAAADSEVVGGEDVGTAEVEDEEHFDGPAADAFDAGEAFDEGGVVEMVAFGEGGDDAGEGFVGEVVEVGGFRAGESGGAEGGEVGARDVVGRGELAGWKEFLEAAENGAGSFAAELLVDDGVDEGLKGRQAAGGEVEGADAGDDAGHDGVGAEVLQGREGAAISIAQRSGFVGHLTRSQFAQGWKVREIGWNLPGTK